MIYGITEEEFNQPPSSLLMKNNLPSPKQVRVLVRVYLVKGIDLHPEDPNGKSDPYLIVKLGEQIMNDREHYIPKQLNPEFGKYYYS